MTKTNKIIVNKMVVNSIKKNLSRLWLFVHKENEDKVVRKLLEPEGAMKIGAKFCGETIVNKDTMFRTYYLKDKGYINYIYFQKIHLKSKKIDFLIVFASDEDELQTKTEMQLNSIKNHKKNKIILRKKNE